jgi:D-alanine-D-alanine ligase
VIKVGIFFGGPSREREISFAGGRTVFDNLDKALFEAVPIFVDSQRRLILLDWPFVYKGTIRDFYPPVKFLPDANSPFQIYVESLQHLNPAQEYDMLSTVGQPIQFADLSKHIDFAFLALHGSFGEDGQIQGLLESLQIPYTGSGIRACSIGIDKVFQKKMMESAGFNTPPMLVFSRKQWHALNYGLSGDWYEELLAKVGPHFVVRPANQGSSIGVKILKNDSKEHAVQAINRAFFLDQVQAQQWQAFDTEAKCQFVRDITDIRHGVGFPMTIMELGQLIYLPEQLIEVLDQHLGQSHELLTMESLNSEQFIIAEGFIKGREFSCIVVRNADGQATALPPTEIIKGDELFDYRSKYLAGLSRKETPIRLETKQINEIRKACEKLYSFLGFGTYARIDGFIQEDGSIFLNDPNTTSGMLPSSFFFHQAAEIGLNASQFLTYIIHASLQERIEGSCDLGLYDTLLAELEQLLANRATKTGVKKKIAVILGGYSSERHISVESGRNIFEKLSSSNAYEPIPVFLTGDENSHQLFQIPINLLFKDNADDIRDKVFNYRKHDVIEQVKQECSALTHKFASADVVFEPRELSYEQLAQMVDGVFIALHGRPGEDGEVQSKLESLGVPFNGSQHDSSSITINKYQTLQTLREHGFTVTDQWLVQEDDFNANPEAALDKAEQLLPYPLIAKPVDDGCSSAVKKIHDREQLRYFLQAIFRPEEEMPESLEQALKLKPKEEFPRKKVALLEKLIDKAGASRFLEITGGLLTHFRDGQVEYEVFEPSEALAGGEVLSLEEKFLAGEGQNITPARFTANNDPATHAIISKQVRDTLLHAAKVLKVTGYARIDAFVRIYDNNRAETIIIEVNSLPGMTPATCIFHQSAINGYKPYDFIDKILNFGFQREASHRS